MFVIISIVKKNTNVGKQTIRYKYHGKSDLRIYRIKTTVNVCC